MTITDLIPAYLKYLHVLGRSPYTVRGVRYSLADFAAFMAKEDCPAIIDITADRLRDYQEDLAFRFTGKGTPLSLSSQIQLICNVKGFTQYLTEQGYLYQNPGLNIRPPKAPNRLPKVILDDKEIKKLMAAPDMRTNSGFRNRVILELLYDTAMRRLELARVKLSDLDLEAGYIRVIGKGDKERVVPVCDRVCQLIKNYLLFIRPAFVQGEDSGHLVLNRWGCGMEPNAVWAVVNRCVHLAGIKKRISTHTFRHTCATHMLKNGAPVRHIQEMLGHESLKSTQVYTRVTINDLKKIHAQYHPSEQLPA